MTEIVFKRPSSIYGPVLSLLQKKGCLAADMHLHTEFSMDGISKIENVLERCKNLNIGVAITDHNEIDGAIKAFKLKKEQFVIPGIEVSCHEGAHVLLYFYSLSECKEFYKKEILPQKKINPFFIPTKTADLIEIASSYNCVICAPHPFGIGQTGVYKAKLPYKTIKKIDLIEGINGVCLRRMNTKAINWAKGLRKGMTAGTDGHTTTELGLDMSLAKGNDIESFLKSLIKGDSIAIGREESLFADGLHQIEKEKIYFKRAIRNHEGMLWLKTHYRTEIARLKKKLKRKDVNLHAHAHHNELNESHKKHPHFKHLV